MPSAKVLLGVLAFVAGAGPGAAAQAKEPMRCLGAEQRRAAIAAHKAIPLSRAIRVARGRHRDRHAPEVVGARLCESSAGLVYVLTLLARDGKVTRVTVDAGNGRVLGRR